MLDIINRAKMDCEDFLKERSENMKRIRKQMRNLPIFQRTLGTGQSEAEKMKLKKATSELVMGNGFGGSEVSGSMSKFLEKYETGEKVGEGTDGVVRVCYHKEKKKRYAVKSMRMEEEQVLFLKRNFLSITHLHHCNVIKYQGLYLDMKRHTANLVMEYETMKPLSTFAHFPERQLKSIMKQLLQTLRYIHSHYLCHRDIKPSNILYDEESGKIKLIDFGISRRVVVSSTKADMLTMTGTLFYRAPEILLGIGYDERVDVWAAGITLYKLIAGYTPFEAQQVSTTIENIQSGKVEFEGEAWEKEGKFVKDFIRRLLMPNPKERLTVEEALKHFWLADVTHHTPKWTMKSEDHQPCSHFRSKEAQTMYHERLGPSQEQKREFSI